MGSWDSNFEVSFYVVFIVICKQKDTQEMHVEDGIQNQEDQERMDIEQ